MGADLGVDDRVEAGLRVGFGTHGTVEAQRIDDLPAGVVVEHHGLEVAGQRFGGAGVVVKDSRVEVHDVLDEGELDVQARTIDLVQRMAKLDDEGLLGLLYDEEALLEQNDHAQKQERENGGLDASHYFAPPFQASSGSRGRTLPPASDGSTSFSMPGLLRISSKVS